MANFAGSNVNADVTSGSAAAAAGAEMAPSILAGGPVPGSGADTSGNITSGFVCTPVVAPAGTRTWVNRAFDNVAGKNVIWETLSAPDIAAGASYPGPGTFDPTEGGNDTESHVVQTILEA